MFARIGITEFKRQIGAEKLDIVKNPKTDKLFVSASNGSVYRCQQDLDIKADMEWLVEDGNLSGACLINAGRGASVVLSL